MKKKSGDNEKKRQTKKEMLVESLKLPKDMMLRRQLMYFPSQGTSLWIW